MNGELLEAQKEWIMPIFDRFKVSYNRGFIPDKDPLLKFTNPYFEPWDEVFQNLTQLIASGKLRTIVESLPLLDHAVLDREEDWARAYLVLSALGNGYVWQNGEHDPVKVIPKNLAIPWFAVAEYFGSCPVIAHWSGILNNWKIKDKTRFLDVDNIETQFVFTGAKDEFWFYAVTWQLEMHAVPGIKSVVAAQKAVLDRNTDLLITCLSILQETIGRLTKTLNKMFEHCRPEVFYSKLRVFLAGWKKNKTLPEGILYEGVSKIPLMFSGGSAAQSTTFQIFDAALGVSHPKIEDGEKSFLESMLDYMPRWHREFVLYVRDGPSIREYVLKSNDHKLQQLYNECIERLTEFRSEHVKIVARYITIQATKSKNVNVKMLANQGTGGTGVMPFLKAVRQKTSERKIHLENGFEKNIP
ncbi:indoleamine 2,3-dioxygenase 2-like [Xenia sp. Carnegie-2017]|uniref:indoleamine 2,3-dioxygenase 2-like n=1 Tax=Xenia sp. Carnegie-2017 TaxID=2897299 RepID=UPI001F04519C|nr:indoleamine 2,3-dioxygenase 2-like [Xenia sp. Carnegie-2017]